MLLSAAPRIASALPPVAPVNCEAEVAKLDEKFTFTTSLGTWSLAEADQERLCAENKNAGLDKQARGNSLDEASTCRNTYAKLKNAVDDYKAKYLGACQRSQRLEEGCGSGQPGEDPTASFRCVARNSRAAGAAERAAAKALERARNLARVLQRQAQRVHDGYLADHKAIVAALDAHERRMAEARSRGDEEEWARLNDILQSANGIRRGELVNDASLLDDLDEKITARRGGRTLLTQYRDDVKSTISGRTGPLLDEQTWALNAAKGFTRTAGSMITERNQAAERLEKFAAENESRGRPGSGPATLENRRAGQPTITSRGNDSILPSPTSLANLAVASTGLAGLAASRGNASPEYAMPAPFSSAAAGSPEEKPAPETSTFGPGGAEGGKAGPIARKAGTSGDAGGSVTANPRTPDDEVFLTGTPLDGADAAAMITGKSTGPLSALTSSSSEGVRTGGGGRSPGSKAGKGSEKCSGSEEDCAAMEDLKTKQFQGGGSLGVPTIGASDPGLSTLGALEGLFGSDSKKGDAKGKIAAMPADASLAGLFGDEGMGGGAPGAADAQSGAHTEAGDSAKTLFTRVHETHEKALKRGAVALVHRKL